MNCHQARDVFPEFLDDRNETRVAPAAQAARIAEARAHLSNCPECQREFASLTQTAAALDAMTVPPPSPRLRKNFYAMLEEEKHSAASTRAVTERQHRARRASLWRWILSPALACGIALIAFQVGTRYGSGASQSSGDDPTRQELAKLRLDMKSMQQELRDTRKVVAYTALQNPANDRLRGILAAAKEDKPSANVIDTLISALNVDPSANVRLRALEALYPHADNKVVRSGIVAALQHEQNPLVQLEMIDFVAAAQEREAAPALEQLSQNDGADQTVRDAAKKALAQL